ncbi:MAG: SpoIID/LytB domain-containing protein [Nocardioidaceae bacterium]|nr:SpoIID/LytB domain-containing protein [Nocardioidaceae bacterium]
MTSRSLALPGRPRRARAAVRVAALVAGAAVLGQAATAGAATDSWTVPADAKIVIKGHGYGHGHGMSQYGAEGAARAGLTFKRISRFYYPGTTWGESGGKISVLISADTTDNVIVLARERLRVWDVAARTSTALPTGTAKRWRLSPSGAGTVLAYRDTAWHTFATFTGEAEFRAKGEPITLVTPTAQKDYRGRLRSAAPSPGSASRDTVNIVNLDTYLRGVVPLEMPALWSPEAVKAQAVAARTYAAYEREHPRAAHYQICDTTSCQVYGGASAEHPASDAAIAATARQVLLADGVPACTMFASSSGGWTSAASAPYLVAKEDPYDDWAGNPVHDWSATFTDDAIEAKYPAIGDLQRIVVVARDGNGDWGGRVTSLRLVGSKSQVTVSGDTLRSALGLRSTWVTFAVKTA